MVVAGGAAAAGGEVCGGGLRGSLFLDFRDDARRLAPGQPQVSR